MKVTITESDGKKKYIGNYDPDTNVFSKKVKYSVHFFKKLNAWGIDAGYYTNVLKDNNSLIIVYDEENQRRYITTARIMAKRGEYKHYKPHRSQIFLVLHYWIQNNDIRTNEEIKRLLEAIK